MITCHSVFNSLPKTTLLPLWPGDARRLDTLALTMGVCSGGSPVGLSPYPVVCDPHSRQVVSAVSYITGQTPRWCQESWGLSCWYKVKTHTFCGRSVLYKSQIM